jgi:hypothetical protein
VINFESYILIDWDWFCFSKNKNKLPDAYTIFNELKVISYTKFDFIFAEGQALN